MRASSILCLLVLGGCGATTSSYVYAPAVRASARVNGHPAAHYAIPTERPAGDVRIGSFGITEVQPQAGGSTTPVAHVRLIAANNTDDVPWTIDTRDAVLSIAGEGTSRPAFVNTDAGTPPVLQIARGEKRTIDLYYPLPTGRSSEDALPAFDVTWRVRTATGDVVQRTPFERERLPDEDEVYAGYYGYPYPYGYFGLGLGFGSYWWYDAYYPAFAFHRHPTVIVSSRYYPHHRVHVVRPYGSLGGRYHSTYYRGGPSYRGPQVSGRYHGTYYRGPQGGGRHHSTYYRDSRPSGGVHRGGGRR